MSYNDPCRCSTIITSPTTPTSPCNGDCIFAPHMLLHGDDSVIMCGATKSILWDEDCLNDCGCGALTPSFVLESYSTNLTAVSVDSTGITFTSAWEEGDSMVADVTYVMSCGRLSSRGSLTIVFNNPCLNVICPENYECNHCDELGGCVASPLDLDVTI